MVRSKHDVRSYKFGALPDNLRTSFKLYPYNIRFSVGSLDFAYLINSCMLLVKEGLPLGSLPTGG